MFASQEPALRSPGGKKGNHKMTLSVSIPTVTGFLEFRSLQNGNKLFVLGANGAGKSALLHHIYQQLPERAHKVAAYRQTYLGSSTLDMSGSQYRAATDNLRKWDRNAQSRYTESQSGYSRTNRTLAALFRHQRGRDRKIAAFVDGGDSQSAELHTRSNPDPFDIINGLFESSNLEVRVFVRPEDPETIVAQRTTTGQTYMAEQLSDGERSALLLAAEVLTAPDGTVFLLDEPERHLHRSIISPLLVALFETRPDCYFVISTHEVRLPEDCGPARVLLLRGCDFGADGVANRWHVDFVPADVEIDDDIRIDIWGARRKLLYVEGKALGPDERLYSALFPEVTVRAKGSWEQVSKTVEAVRSESHLHWLEVYGLIDGDNRDSEDIAKLKAKGTDVLPLRAVESLLYGGEIRNALARRQAEHLGQPADELIGKARQAVLGNVNTLKPLTPVEQSELSELVEAADIEGVVAKFPIGKSSIPAEIAKCLGYTGRKQYEHAAFTRVNADEAVRDRLIEACGSIAATLSSNDDTPAESKIGDGTGDPATSV